MNTYFHGSPVSHLKTLEPRVSNHNNAFVYFSSNFAVSILYTVRCNWYTYGFTEDVKNLEYTEYYPNQLKDLYLNKSGSVYECFDFSIEENPTNIYCAFVSKGNVNVFNEIFIPNIYEEIIKLETKGDIVIKRYKTLSISEKEAIKKQFINEIKSETSNNPNSEYLHFLNSRFRLIEELMG